MMGHILNLLRKCGVDVCRHRPGYQYLEVQPGHHVVPDYYGRSASERLDIRTFEPFSTLANRVISDKRSFLYFDCLYTIYQALLNMKRVAPPDAQVAEIGVYRGGGSYFMASVLRHFNMAQSELHCFDTFSGHVESDINPSVDEAGTHVPGKFGDVSLDSVREYLREFPNVRFHPGRIQDAAAEAAALRFGFVHIDVDLYEPTLYALDFFGDRLVPGGVMIVDDYDCITCPGVRRAVTEFTAAQRKYVGFELFSSQCIVFKYAT